MNKQELSTLLGKYEYKHATLKNRISIDIGLSQELNIYFTEAGTVKMRDRLTAWNPLTGIIPLSVKGSIIYNIIGTIFILAVFFYLDRLQISNGLVLISLGLVSWIVLWTIYYHVKAENFKRLMIDWLERSDKE